MKQSYKLKKGAGILLIFTSIAILFFLFFRYRVASPFPLEKISLANDQEKFIELMHNKKKPVIVSFYAYWCGECLMEMNDWIHFENGKILENFEIILISDEKNAGLEVIQSRYPQLKNVFISTQPLSNYSIHAFPTNYVFDKNGNLNWKSVGSVSPESLKSLIESNE